MPCELCDSDGGEVLWRDAGLRVVAVDGSPPGICRVIWNAHVREMTDLDAAARMRCMHAVWHVEQALREVLQPDKINLASLGNLTPHLHWHVIPRWRDDAHFPQPIWAPPTRRPSPRALRGDWRARVAERLRVQGAA